MTVEAVELANGKPIRRREVAAEEILKEHMQEHHRLHFIST